MAEWPVIQECHPVEKGWLYETPTVTGRAKRHKSTLHTTRTELWVAVAWSFLQKSSSFRLNLVSSQQREAISSRNKSLGVESDCTEIEDEHPPASKCSAQEVTAEQRSLALGLHDEPSHSMWRSNSLPINQQVVENGGPQGSTGQFLVLNLCVFCCLVLDKLLNHLNQPRFHLENGECTCSIVWLWWMSQHL